MIDNRELASVVWIGVVLIAGLTRPAIRASLLRLVYLLLGPKIAIPILALGAWSTALASTGCTAGLWNTRLTSSTVVWFVFTALALLLNINHAGERGFLRRAAVESLKASALAETFINFYVFSLPVELILLPLVAMLAGVSAVASYQPELVRAKGCVNRALAVVGLSIFVYGCVRAIADWRDFVSAETARTFALPVWMTLGILPFIYAVGLYSSYELAFVRIDLATEDRVSRRRAKLALCATLHVRLSRVASFVGLWPRLVARASSFKDARTVMREFLSGREGAVEGQDGGLR